jgi:hypothetical protein
METGACTAGLIHHVLAERGFTPPGMLFQVSSVMLERIDDYRTILQAHSRPVDALYDGLLSKGQSSITINERKRNYKHQAT